MHDDFDVTGVHIHKRTLFLIVGLPAHEARLQQGYGVRELLLTCGINFLADTLSLGLVELTVVALLQFFLQVKNFVFKSQFVDFVLGFEGKNLIVSVLTESGSVVALQIHFLDFVNSFADLTTVDFVNAHLVA